MKFCQYEDCKKPTKPGKPYCHGHLVIAFIERYCTHTKGRWAGSRFKLIEWQREMLLRAFGTLKKNGKRQYRIVYCEVSKKNGKTELAACIALFGLSGDGEMGAEVYSAAGDKDQASLVYGPAAQMVRNNKRLSKRLKVLDSRRRIIDYITNSFYQVLSSDVATKHGYNPSVVVFDELHAQPNRELWDVLVEGTDTAREQQLIFVITTAGVYDKNSIGWKIHDYARKVRDGVIEDETFLPIIYGAFNDADDWKPDDWEKEDHWIAANPSINHIFDLEKLRQHYRAVKNDPSRVNNFMRYRLCLWVGQISRYLPMNAWDLCSDPVDKGQLLKRTCYGGLDLSSTIDLSAFLLVFPPEHPKEKWAILPKFYVPQDSILERSHKDGVPYDMWARAGLITATPGNVIDYGFIRKDINAAADLYDLKEVAYDPWGAVKLATELENDDGIAMFQHRQGFASMSNPTKQLLTFVLAGDLAHGNHPVLRWCADNLAVQMDAAENVKPAKNKSKERIDGIVALIMALGAALLQGDHKSRYETDGAEVVVF